LVIIFKIWRCITPLIQNNFLNRLAQIQETGIQARIRQQYMLSKEPEEPPSTIDVSMLTVASIFVVLAAGYVVAIFVLLIELCVQGNTLKCWSHGSV
jgi:hypothetical protein